MSDRSPSTAALMMTSSSAMTGILSAPQCVPFLVSAWREGRHRRGGGANLGAMRHTEFWARMDHALGRAYSRTWAEQQVIAGLDHRTVTEALEAGEPPKQG